MRRLAAIVALLMMLAASPAYAVSLIRDAEIEHTLRMMANPIFRTAGLNPDAIHIFIVQDDSVNAYVAGGQNLFIHTGLILEMQDPSMLIGVMAHETGHISGGHLARGAEKLRNAQLGSILGYVLGAAAAIGNPNAGMAVMTGTQEYAQRHLMSFSRDNERAADEAGLRYMDQMGVSAQGMLRTFKLLYRNAELHPKSPDPYVLTHPLTEERIEYVRHHIDVSSIAPGKYPKEYDVPFQRMRAKLYAFLNLPPKTFARYPQNDHSAAARMARAVAWYKIPELEKALSEVNSLLKDYPKDPFVYDLKGQILFENGRLRDAADAYAKAVSLMPDSPLLLTSLAQVRLSLNDAANTRAAVSDLEKANALDNSNGDTWRLLATAQGKLGNDGQAHLALAEEASLGDDYDTMKREADLALKALPASSPGRLRAEDLKRLAEELKKEAKG